MAETSGCIVFGFNLIWSNDKSKLHGSAKIGKNITVVGDFNSFEKSYSSQNWIICPSSVKKKYILKPPPRIPCTVSSVSSTCPDTSCTLRGSTRNLQFEQNMFRMHPRGHHLEMSDVIWHHCSSFICPYIDIIMCTCNLINMMCKTVWITSPNHTITY